MTEPTRSAAPSGLNSVSVAPPVRQVAAPVPFGTPRPGARYPRLRSPAATAGNTPSRRRPGAGPAPSIHGLIVASGLMLALAATALAQGQAHGLAARGPFAGPALPPAVERPVPIPP